MYQSRSAFDARIVTPTFRAYGKIHLASEESTEALLNSLSRSLVPVTEPLIYAADADHPPDQSQLRASAGFLAVHRDQIRWLVGGRAPARQQDAERSLALLFEAFVLVGKVGIPPEVRSSDFLESAATFQTLHDAALFPWQSSAGRFLLLGRDSESLLEVGAMTNADAVTTLQASERFPFVTVNLKQATGVLEAHHDDGGQVRSAPHVN